MKFDVEGFITVSYTVGGIEADSPEEAIAKWKDQAEYAPARVNLDDEKMAALPETFYVRAVD